MIPPLDLTQVAKMLRKSSRIIYPYQLMFMVHSLYAGHFTNKATFYELCSSGH